MAISTNGGSNPTSVIYNGKNCTEVWYKSSPSTTAVKVWPEEKKYATLVQIHWPRFWERAKMWHEPGWNPAIETVSTFNPNEMIFTSANIPATIPFTQRFYPLTEDKSHTFNLWTLQKPDGTLLTYTTTDPVDVLIDQEGDWIESSYWDNSFPPGTDLTKISLGNNNGPSYNYTAELRSRTGSTVWTGTSAVSSASNPAGNTFYYAGELAVNPANMFVIKAPGQLAKRFDVYCTNNGKTTSYYQSGTTTWSSDLVIRYFAGWQIYGAAGGGTLLLDCLEAKPIKEIKCMLHCSPSEQDRPYFRIEITQED